MSKNSKHHEQPGSQLRWLFFAHSKYAISVVFVLCTALFGYLSHSPLEEILEDNIGRPLLFHARDALNQTPTLDPRIKVLAYDDNTVAAFGRPEIVEPGLWLELVNEVAKRKPKLILFDRVFANKTKNSEQLQQTLAIFNRPTPVGSGVFLTHQELTGWNQAKFRRNGNEPIAFALEYGRNFDGLQAYGPATEFEHVLQIIGHINYRSPGWFHPVVAFQSGDFLPHLSLLAADQFSFSGDHLIVNQQPAHLNKRGEALVNWSKPTDYYKISYSIAALLKRARSGQELSAVQTGDIVYILPQMYTGSADFKGTMIGAIPGGYSQVSSLNMVLQNNWIRVVQGGIWGVLLACLLGCFTAYWRRTSTKLLFIVLADTIMLSAIIGLFSTQAIAVNWLIPTLAFNICSMSIFILRTVSQEIFAMRVEDALRGVIAPKILQSIKKNPAGFKIKPQEVTVTVLFVDLVGFSANAESVIPQTMFKYLKNELGGMANMIHQYGGIVDKTLGDGLMGFFGYDPLTNEISANHADQALNCAAAIQIELAHRCVSPALLDAPFFPARIGINTGRVYVGDLGDNGKIDLTLIGHTVNLSKRLEDAAAPFKLLLGPKTRDELLDSQLRDRLASCKVSLKHQTSLFDAFEYDPFDTDRELYRNAMQKVRERSELERLEERHLISAHQTWEIWRNGKKIGQCIDYSASGCCLDLDTFFSSKVQLLVDLKIIERNVMGEERVLLEINDICGKVCWGKVTESEDVYRHGLLFTDETIRRLRTERPRRLEEIAQNRYLRRA